MTVTKALWIAHERGMVKAPFRPGMRIVDRGVYGRIIAVSESGIRLMEWEARVPHQRTWAWVTVPRIWEIDLTDDCTVGGLSGLVREVCREPLLSCAYVRSVAAWLVPLFTPRVGDPESYDPIESYVGEADAWKLTLYRALRLVDLGGGS